MTICYTNPNALSHRTLATISPIMVLLLFLSVASGCTTFSTMTKATHTVAANAGTAGKHLNKIIGIAVFGYKTFPVDFSLEDTFQNILVKEIRSACPKLVVITPDDTSSPEVLKYPPRYASGKIDNFVLSQKGRQVGLNSIVVGSPIDVSEAFEEKGHLWFKDTHNFLRFQIETDVYDTATGAKLLGENVICKIEMNPAYMDKIKEKNYMIIPEFNEAMITVAGQIAEKLCDEVAFQPWKGYVTEVVDKQITLSAGYKTGLKAGDILEIYDSKDAIEGVDSQRFYLSGKKTGEIKITYVNPDHSNAILISGKDISAGDVALFKD